MARTRSPQVMRISDGTLRKQYHKRNDTKIREITQENNLVEVWQKRNGNKEKSQ